MSRKPSRIARQSVQKKTRSYKPNAAKQQGQLLEKARNEMGELAYMVPVKELTGTVTFRHLLRFSQKGQFVLPPARYVRSYAPAQQSVAAGSEWTGMQVK